MNIDRDCWCKLKDVPRYKNVNYIHPLKQRVIYELISYTKEVYGDDVTLVVFGSTTSSRCTDTSDIDLLVGGPKAREFVPPLNDEYDIVYLDTLNKNDPLVEEIKRDGVLIYG